MIYKKINVELIVVADESDAVIAELNSAIDQLEEGHTIFGGAIETGRYPAYGNTEEIGAHAHYCGWRDGGCCHQDGR